MPLRFAVDDRVRCRVGPTTWAAGAVVQLWYREPDWPSGRSVPYQIALDDGQLIFAPADHDGLIRAEANFEQLLYADEQARDAASARRREELVAKYRPHRKHEALYEPTELARWLDPAINAALDDELALRSLLHEEARGLFSLRFFTTEYCTLLLEECEHFEAWCVAEGEPLQRPNTMNNHGCILDDLGMDDAMQALMRRVVEPLATLAGFGDVTSHGPLETHHAFVVEYALGKDVDLSFHVDSSDVTLNVCLGKEGFEGGGLFFRGVRCRAHQQTGADPDESLTYAHKPGVGVIHRGHHRHGAHELTSGERYNLILWCRANPKASSEGANRHPNTCQPWCWRHGGGQPRSCKEVLPK